MNPLTLVNTDGEIYADSRDVAEAIEREHKLLLRTIRSYCEILNGSKIAPVEFFIEAEYEDSKGEKRPCYFITHKGCDMIANKLTGKKGVLRGLIFNGGLVPSNWKMRSCSRFQLDIQLYVWYNVIR